MSIKTMVAEGVELFKDHPDDEQGGTHALRGFSFQVWWAVWQAIKCHCKPDDYAVVLEWQQDVAVLNSASNPTRLKFIQLKKNESSLKWSLPSLLTPDKADPAPDLETASSSEDTPPRKKRKKPPNRSVLAKIYHHRLRFAPHAETVLEFISNAPFSVGVEDDEATVHNVSLANLSVKEIERINLALRKQLELDEEAVVDLSSFSLECTTLPLDEAFKFLLGDLQLRQHEGKIPFPIRSPVAAVLLIGNYVLQRAGSRSFAKNLPDLLKRGVTRQEMDIWLRETDRGHEDTEGLLKAYVGRLNAEAAPMPMVRSMSSSIDQVQIELTNRSNQVLWDLVRDLKELHTNNPNLSNAPLLTGMLIEWGKLYRLFHPVNSLYDDGYLYCLMALIDQNARTIQQLQPAASDPQPA